MGRYNERGVSSKKEDVHNALKGKIDKGLFPGAFCKIIPDYLGGDERYCNVMHADGAGTKSSLAYIYYKETGDINIFKGIVTDCIVMNLDDLLCVGACDNFLLSNTIGRNSKYISGEIIKVIIHEFEQVCDKLNDLGISLKLTGGETADVGDLVRTLIADSTITARIKRSDVISCKNIKPGMVIVGLSSFGQASYEDEYNSGIGSNGLTSARHEIFTKEYIKKYPESFNPMIPENLVYCGPYKVTDVHQDIPINMGKAVLSPTRTYAPIIKSILKEYKNKIGGMIHCTGGAQTKCLNFGNNIHYIKDNMFNVPPIFKIIKEVSGTAYKEMYEVFNMGHRMELFVESDTAEDIINISKSFKVDAKIIGRIKSGNNNRLSIKSPEGFIEY